MFFRRCAVRPCGGNHTRTRGDSCRPWAIAEAERCREEGKSETILFNLCGHGHFDLGAYETYLRGELKLHELSEAEIAASLAKLDTPTIG